LALHDAVKDGAGRDTRGRGGEPLGARTEVFALDEKNQAGQPGGDDSAAEQGAPGYGTGASANTALMCVQRLYVRASVVSPLIHSRYLSRPASTGSARSSGTL